MTWTFGERCSYGRRVREYSQPPLPRPRKCHGPPRRQIPSHAAAVHQVPPGAARRYNRPGILRGRNVANPHGIVARRRSRGTPVLLWHLVVRTLLAISRRDSLNDSRGLPDGRRASALSNARGSLAARFRSFLTSACRDTQGDLLSTTFDCARRRWKGHEYASCSLARCHSNCFLTSTPASSTQNVGSLALGFIASMPQQPDPGTSPVCRGGQASAP